MKMYWGAEVQLHHSQPRHWIKLGSQGKSSHGNHWIWGWVGSRAGLDAVNREISCSCWEYNPARSARCYTDWTTVANIIKQCAVKDVRETSGEAQLGIWYVLLLHANGASLLLTAPIEKQEYMYTKEWCGFKCYETIYFSPNTGTAYTVSSRNCPSLSCATSSSFHMLTAGRKDQFPRRRRNRRRLSVCSVFKWSQCSVSFVHGLKKTRHTRIIYFLNRTLNSRSTVSGHLKTEDTESLLLLRRHLGNWCRGPAVSMRSELLVAHEKFGQFLLLTVYVVPV
jgi:hypothetical protein